MEFIPTRLKDVYEVHASPHEDARGFFARLRCSREFAEHELPGSFVQTNLSFNARKGTFRGLHFQVPPSHEGKLVRCMSGSLRDVVVDLRPHSETFLQHVWITLQADRLNAVFVPPGFGHGFLTEKDGVSVLYEMTDYYVPELSRGLRWNDPLLGIGDIPEIASIHPRDAAYPNLDLNDLEVFRT